MFFLKPDKDIAFTLPLLFSSKKKVSEEGEGKERKSNRCMFSMRSVFDFYSE